MVAEAEGKGTAEPSVLSSHGTLHIGDVAALVLLFQVHVHHKLLRIHVVAQCFAHVRLLVVDLDVLHRVVRKILHQHLLVAPHERVRTKQQFIHLASVHEYLARLVQRHTRHLAYQVVKHRALRQLECRGIIDDGVAPVEHLYTGGFHNNFVQVQFPHLAHLYRRHLHLCLFAADVHALPYVVIALQLGVHQQHFRVGRHLRRVFGKQRSQVAVVGREHRCRIDQHTAVGSAY